MRSLRTCMLVFLMFVSHREFYQVLTTSLQKLLEMLKTDSIFHVHHNRLLLHILHSCSVHAYSKSLLLPGRASRGQHTAESRNCADLLSMNRVRVLCSH